MNTSNSLKWKPIFLWRSVPFTGPPANLDRMCGLQHLPFHPLHAEKKRKGETPGEKVLALLNSKHIQTPTFLVIPIALSQEPSGTSKVV